VRTTISKTCFRRKRPSSDIVQWARSMAAMPPWVLAASHDLTLSQAERVQAILADLAGQAGAR
jgi:hypothetical protein